VIGVFLTVKAPSLSGKRPYFRSNGGRFGNRRVWRQITSQDSQTPLPGPGISHGLDNAVIRYFYFGQ
jgi:hypothetical protein